MVVSDIDETAGNETVEMLTKAGGDALFVKADVTHSQDVKKIVVESVEKFGSLDFAINNAGALSAEARTGDYSEEDWRRLIDINLTGVFLCMKYELQQMAKQNNGVIVNMASIAGITGFPRNSAYAASKHGVVGLTKSAAIEYARKGIRINAVCPGYTLTPMAETAMKLRGEPEGELEKRVPLGRLGKPEEIARAIIYLCSDSGRFHPGPLSGSGRRHCCNMSMHTQEGCL